MDLIVWVILMGICVLLIHHKLLIVVLSNRVTNLEDGRNSKIIQKAFSKPLEIVEVVDDKLNHQCADVFEVLNKLNIDTDRKIEILDQCIEYLRLDDIATLSKEQQ